MKNRNEKCYDIDFIINSLGRGGAERVCITLANEMERKGYNIRIITLRSVINNYNEDVSKNVCVKCLYGKKDIFGLFKLMNFLKNNKVKKIIAFDERIASVCNYVKIKNKKSYKVISRVINNIDFQEKNNKKLIYKLIFKFSKKYFKYCDKYIFQCNEMKNRMVKYFNLNLNDSKMISIYNPLANDFYNIPINLNKSNYFLMVGRLDKQKGYEYLINTLRICKKMGKNINVKILGDGRLKKKIEKLSRKYDLNIQLLGNIRNPKDYYRNAKALILTSIYEGFPNVVLEANACGCPAISFDCPTGPSEIINADNGILVKYLDINEFSKILINFDNLIWDYEKIAKTTNKYQKEIIINKYISEVENI